MKIVIWGTGNCGEHFFDKTYKYFRREGIEIVGVTDDRYSGYFHHFPILSPAECEELDPDYLLWLESSRGLSKDKSAKLLSADYSKKLLSLPEFMERIGAELIFNDKNVLFFGNKQVYEVMCEGTENLFKSSVFVAEQDLDRIEKTLEYDYIFICGPWYKTPKESKIYDKKCVKLLTGRGISSDTIIVRDVWEDFWARSMIRVKTGGNLNPDKNFLVYHPRRFVGMAVVLQHYLQFMDYAKKNKMIPIVDMQNFSNLYQTVENMGKTNPWDCFFEQPSKYDLSEVYKSKNVWLFSTYTGHKGYSTCECIRLNSKVNDSLKKESSRFFSSLSDRILGVIYRGTDYNTVTNESTPLGIEDFIARVEKVMHEHDYEYIFLATEVKEVTEIFKKHFGDKVFFTDQQRFSINERRILAYVHFDRENDEYQKGLEYLTVLYLLRKCKALVGMRCGAFGFVTTHNPNLEYVEAFEDAEDKKKSNRERNRVFINKLWRRFRRVMRIGAYSK